MEADVRFTRPDVPGPDTLLSVLYVKRQEGVDSSHREIRAELTRSIRQRFLGQGYEVRPLVDIAVQDSPDSPD